MPVIRPALLALLAVVGTIGPGCRTMKRTLEIDTEPSGARIWIDGREQASRTPVRLPFTWYRTWEVRAELDGYQRLAAEVHVPTRPDGYPVLDLVLERTTPDLYVRRVLRLEPLVAEPTEADSQQVLERARAFRQHAEAEAARGLPPGTERKAP